MFGDIYDNFLDNTLCNYTNVTAAAPDDVSMAMGWDFVHGAGETGVVSFFLSDTNGAGDLFYVTYADMDSPDKVYFWGSLEITSTDVPEPGSLMLFSLGLIGLGMLTRRKVVA